VNCVVPPEVTVAVAGLTATEIVPPVVVLLPPPQPEMIDMNASTNERERHFDKSLSMMVLSAV
jgi:hypothetical protein